MYRIDHFVHATKEHEVIKLKSLRQTFVYAIALFKHGQDEHIISRSLMSLHGGTKTKKSYHLGTSNKRALYVTKEK
jgi:hypothetical protein